MYYPTVCMYMCVCMYMSIYIYMYVYIYIYIENEGLHQYCPKPCASFDAASTLDRFGGTVQ